MPTRLAISRALATRLRQPYPSKSYFGINQLSTSAHLEQETASAHQSEAAAETNVAADKARLSVPTTNELQFIEPAHVSTVPAYSVLKPDGELASDHGLDPQLTADKIVEMYVDMVTLNAMDKILYDSQRQGRISFYMTHFGEEAASVGSAAALSPNDWVFAQYREAGVVIHRKMPLKLMLAQCYGNKEDLSKGRSMPIHYGSKELNFVTLSSTLTTQLPQAVGAAYTFKMAATAAAAAAKGTNQQTNSVDKIVMCYFGDGAASEGDAHAAMNFAATLECPVVFFCRNNGYAISTPTREQFKSDGIVHRALGYGMSATRVDGNDLFAVFEATREARRLCQTECRPVLVEAMTYRVGHHSTSDDSSAYRSGDEVASWERHLSPMGRVQKYLLAQGLWSDERERQAQQAARNQVIEALNHAEQLKKLPVSTMFEEVYNRVPAHIERQRRELAEHLDKYGQHYPIDEHEIDLEANNSVDARPN